MYWLPARTRSLRSPSRRGRKSLTSAQPVRASNVLRSNQVAIGGAIRVAGWPGARNASGGR